MENVWEWIFLNGLNLTLYLLCVLHKIPCPKNLKKISIILLLLLLHTVNKRIIFSLSFFVIYCYFILLIRLL